MDIDGVRARSARGDLPPGMLLALMEDLLQYDLPTAPHVLSRMFHELHGDLPTIREVVAQLTPSQRQGLRPLPSPLPLVPPIANDYAHLSLTAGDVEILLAAALSLHDDLESIVGFADLPASDILRTAAGAHLVIHAGRCRLRDPRLGIWLRETIPPAVQIGVHARLSGVTRRAGDDVAADWHWARSSLRGVPATAAELTRIARELSEAGEPDRALLLAAEATAHAVGADRDEARLVAGMAAMGAGFAAEAADWLGGVFPDGAERYRLQALGGLLVARTHLQGAVPELDPAALRPSSDDLEDWYSWARAAAFGAVLSAERHDRRSVRSWLEALREGCVRTGAEEQLRDPVVALCWLLLGEDESELRPGNGPLTGDILAAMRAALGGDVEEGLRQLATGRGVGEVDAFVAGFEQSPVVSAYRAVTQTLLLVWRGDIGAARRALIEAASTVPVALPFGGLGVLLARRLDLAVCGRLTAFALSLMSALPGGRQDDQLLDRSIEAHLAGAFEESARLHGLWRDRGSPAAALDVLGLEEFVTPADHEAARSGPQPPEERKARALIVRAGEVEAWRAGELGAIAAETRTLRSPFARARVETMLGRRHAIRGDRAAARTHLLTARSLFEDAGADAWAASVERRLERLGPSVGESGQGDLLDACRRAWALVLTARELEVAMLVVGGTKNRDIAAALKVSVRTVEVHVGRLFGKFAVSSRGELTALAHRTGQHL